MSRQVLYAQLLQGSVLSSLWSVMLEAVLAASQHVDLENSVVVSGVLACEDSSQFS